MSALSSGFFSDQARSDAGDAFNSALQDLKEKYEKKAAEEEAVKAAEEAAARGDESDTDSDLEALLDDPEFERIRQARLAQLKLEAESARKHLALGHGRYKEIAEDEFLPEVTSSKWVICHFYHREFLRCKIMDKHLRILAPKFVATKFVFINAEKTPFFVTKLAIKTLPTVVLFEDGVAKDRLVGFDGLGDDDFPTKRLEKRLKKKGILRKKVPVEGKPPVESESEDEDEDEFAGRIKGSTMRIAIAGGAGGGGAGAAAAAE